MAQSVLETPISSQGCPTFYAQLNGVSGVEAKVDGAILCLDHKTGAMIEVTSVAGSRRPRRKRLV
jgi:hypothetical protein